MLCMQKHIMYAMSRFYNVATAPIGFQKQCCKFRSLIWRTEQVLLKLLLNLYIKIKHIPAIYLSILRKLPYGYDSS